MVEQLTEDMARHRLFDLLTATISPLPEPVVLTRELTGAPAGENFGPGVTVAFGENPVRHSFGIGYWLHTAHHQPHHIFDAVGQVWARLGLSRTATGHDLPRSVQARTADHYYLTLRQNPDRRLILSANTPLFAPEMAGGAPLPPVIHQYRPQPVRQTRE